MKVDSVQCFCGPADLNNHTHDVHQILFVAEGSVLASINGNDYVLEAGTLMLISRFEEHSVKVISKNCTRYALYISPESSSSVKNDYLLTSVLVNRGNSFRHVIDTHANVAEFLNIFVLMNKEYLNKDVFYREKLDICFSNLLISLYRYFPEIFSQEKKSNIEIVERIQRKFEENYSEDISLSALSEEYHISSSHLAHVFKSVTGYSPIDYLLTCRLTAAKKLLVDSDLPIKVIVDSCGFADESNFSRMFKYKVGVTPSTYRKNSKK